MFLTDKRAQELRRQFGTPLFVYSERRLRQAAERALAVPAPYGLTVRYAMKANPTRAILRLFNELGLHFDASSVFEARRAILAGIEPARILLTTQELQVREVELLLRQGMKINASSLEQLLALADLSRENSYLHGLRVGLRVNPGIGSGHHAKTTVGGECAGFGIWHQNEVSKAKMIAASTALVVERIHIHVGSGSDPEVLSEIARQGIKLIKEFRQANTLNVGGGFRVDRMSDDLGDIAEMLNGVCERLSAHKMVSGRPVHLEIEPGTFLIANAGVLLATVVDVKSSTSNRFIVLDAGMTEIMRPSLYGSQHAIHVAQLGHAEKTRLPYMVIGHCCESGDVLTVRHGQAFSPSHDLLPVAKIGDIVSVGGAGAYCSSMSAKNYNSFPEAAEVMLYENGRVQLIRQRQTLEQIAENEL